jgi:hypothetical protein
MKTRESDVAFTVNDGRLTAHDEGLNMRRAQDVAIPEGVVIIGARTMRNFQCRKLTMPSTLKVIEKEAFQSACIDNIDFGDCKLARIEDLAFDRCRAKAELPDTVEYIGALCNLSLAKGQKLKLPKSLKYIGMSALYLGGIIEVELQESLVMQDSNIAHWLHRCVPCKHWVTFRVFRDGNEVYRFVHEGFWRIDLEEQNYIGLQGMLYHCYDDHFFSSSMRCKVNMAAYRLVWPIDLPKDLEKKYWIYVRGNFLALIDGKEEDMDSIRLFNKAGLISAFRFNQLLEKAMKKENVELAAFLIEEMNKKSGPKAKSLKL